MMNTTWSSTIDKLMFWRGSNWIKYSAKLSKLVLRIHCDQIIITTESTVIESLNMHWKIKGIHKEDILILIVWSAEQEVRKLKFQIKCDVANCLQKLGEHFPIVNYQSMHACNLSIKYRRIEDVLRHAIEENGKKTPLKLPPAYNNFVKLCLLDPTFPILVHETENIIYKLIFKN